MHGVWSPGSLRRLHGVADKDYGSIVTTILLTLVAPNHTTPGQDYTSISLANLGHHRRALNLSFLRGQIASRRLHVWKWQIESVS